jgi:hypothetical protein
MDRFCSSFGRVPVSPFVARCSQVSCVNCPISVGMVPESWFPTRSMAVTRESVQEAECQPQTEVGDSHPVSVFHPFVFHPFPFVE